MTVALATCQALPELDADDRHLYNALQQAGVPADIVSWDQATDWSRYDACIIRSTWDYVPRREEYVAWAKEVARQTTLWNPAPLIHWNSSKAYLRDLETQGIAIVESRWLDAGSCVDFEALLHESNWAEMVVKPLVSAGGNHTFRLNRDTVKAHHDELTCLLAERDLMAQPFMQSVQSRGELSFLFFNGEFSHAVQKIPATDDFRVQEHRGGTTQRLDPSAHYIAFATNCLRQAPWPTLYARVDILLDKQDRPLLTELELTEPSMYLAHHPQAAQRFAGAVQKRLNRAPG